jgi:hypothetical protein
MVLTRAEGRAALTHLINNVFSLEADNFLSAALTGAGYADICDVANMREEDIDSLEYPDANDNPVTVPRYLKALIQIFKQYITYCNDISDPIGDGRTTITAEQFDIYCTSNNYLVGHRPTVATTRNTATVSATNNTPRPHDVISDFKKTIKCDSSVFMVYKDEKQWDTWQHSTLAQARPQDVAEVLDSAFTPTTPDEIALCNEKKKFMYAVFEHTLPTDQGKALVRNHDNDFDAQAIYKDLVEYSINSTKASLDTSNTLKYITAARIGDSN